MKNVTNEAYARLVKDNAPPSPMGKNMLWAFLVGGSICTLGQLLSNFFQSWGLDQEQAGTAVSLTLIFLTAVLTGLGIFDVLAKHAGAGTLVPITGFANAVVSPAVEFKTEGFVTGTATKLFQVAGPVLVFGISASVVYGMILMLLQGF
jgi:stage V sporulation protein AC